MIASDVYKLSRTEMARIASEEYVRSFWWFVAIVPFGGLVALITARGPLQVLGWLALMWPFSIPARSVLFTTKASRLFTGGCHVEASDEQIEFLGEYHDGKRLRFAIEMEDVKEAVRRRELILVRMRRPGIAPIRASAFKADADRDAFFALIERAVAARGEESSNTQAPTP